MLVDDHPMLRDGLQVMLESRRKFHVVQSCANGKEALKYLANNPMPAVIVSDVRMPELDGFAFLKKLRSFYPEAKLLLLAGMPLNHEEKAAREGGARGYLAKSAPIDSLAGAIEGVARGTIDFAADEMKRERGILSRRETEVLKLIAEGKQREDVARELNISPETVKSRMKIVMMKLDATNAASAVKRAYEEGILQT